MRRVQHLQGHTFHKRRGDVKNAFRYTVDYVLLDAEKSEKAPLLFGRNRANVMSLHDRDHGGAPKQGRGAKWVREVLDTHGIAFFGKVSLLAQPRVLGHVFNPVSFWLCHDFQGYLRVVIAEVSNTFGDRHCYLLHHEDGAAITGSDTMVAQKIFHVSPFQPVEGEYRFRFDFGDDHVNILIDYRHGEGGVVATLEGGLVPLTNRGILKALTHRPFGSRRVLTLIYWQALLLKLKGAVYRRRPLPPETEVSQ